MDFHEARQSGCAHAQETADCTSIAFPDGRWGRQAAGEWRGQGEGGCRISRSCGAVMMGLSSGGGSLLGRLQRTFEAAAKRGREGKRRGSLRVGGDSLSMCPTVEAWGGTPRAPRAEKPMPAVPVCQALWLTTWVWGLWLLFWWHDFCRYRPCWCRLQQGAKCLVRATDGKKKISCAVLAKDSVRWAAVLRE